MNVKRVTLGLLVSCTLAFLGCKKPEPNVDPTIDAETETALDAVWATYVVSDIEQACAFVGENQLLDHFYIAAAGSSGTMTAVRDSNDKRLSLAWNKTTCVDGRFRDGTVSMNFKPDYVNNPKANANAVYYHSYGFMGTITLSEYKVDNWLIKLYEGGAPAYVYNLLETDKWDPKTTNLSWRIAGKFILIHPTDSTRNIIWDGELIKELTNTSDPKIFPTNKLGYIKWKRANPDDPKEVAAHLKYWGHVNGSTHKVGLQQNKNVGKPYHMVIDKANAAVRDYTCYPEKVASVATTNSVGVVVQRYAEHHPFVKGIASFTTETAGEMAYPRQIYFGNEGHPQFTSPCDNVGEILIKGISYEVNFRE